MKISTFEECYTGGWLLDTYPRQCVSNTGEIFTEALEEEVIYSRRYGSSTRRETGRFITSTRDGGQLIAGDANFGCWILKLDSSGEKEWESSFEQELSQELQLNTGFTCRFARQTPDDSYIVMGKVYDKYFGLIQEPFFIITLYREGNLLSAQVIAKKAGKFPYLDQDGNLVYLTSPDIPGKVAETIDGGYIIVGKYPESSPNRSTYIMKTDTNGSYVWDKNLCLDKNIQQAWEKQIVCSYNFVFDVIQLQDGSVVITGTDNGGWLLKTDVNGNVEWIQLYPPELGSSGHALTQLSDGGYLIAGYDGTLIKTDDVGNMQWSRTYRGGTFRGLEQKPNGEITIMGAMSFAGSDDLWLLGIDSTILK